LREERIHIQLLTSVTTSVELPLADMVVTLVEFELMLTIVAFEVAVT